MSTLSFYFKICDNNNIGIVVYMMKVTNDFYKQFEELNHKLDSLIEENKLLREKFKISLFTSYKSIV